MNKPKWTQKLPGLHKMLPPFSLSREGDYPEDLILDRPPAHEDWTNMPPAEPEELWGAGDNPEDMENEDDN